MNRRVMAVTAAAVMSMSGFAVPAMADEEEAVSIQISASIMSMDPLIGGDSTNVAVISNTMDRFRMVCVIPMRYLMIRRHILSIFVTMQSGVMVHQ